MTANVQEMQDGLAADRPGPPGTLLFENEQIRIWELILRPGEYCLWHEHPYDHLLIVSQGALIEGVMADGERITLDLEDHQVCYVPRGRMSEAARNLSPDRTLREIIVDLKTPALDDNALAIVDFFRPGTANTARLAPVY